MVDSLDEIDWLTQSENRVAVLEALQEGREERSALQELTGVSRVTSNRMLAALEEHDWIIRDEHEHEITPTGRMVAEDLDRLLDTTETAAKLGDIQQYLPVEEFDFDLRRLGNARITQPTPNDTMKPLTRSAEAVVEAAHLRLIGDAPDPIHVRAVRDLCEEDPRSVELVFIPSAYGAVTNNADMSRWFQEIFELGDCSHFLYDGDHLAMR